MFETIVLSVLGACAVITTVSMIYFGSKLQVTPDITPPSDPHTSYVTFDASLEAHPKCPIAPAAAQVYTDAWYRAAHELRFAHKHLPAAHKVSADKAMGDLVRAMRAFIPSDYLSTTAAILNAEHRRKTEASS